MSNGNTHNSGIPIEKLEGFLEQVEQEGFLVSVRPFKFHLPDPDDEPFIEVALSGGLKHLSRVTDATFREKSTKG
jgi:hypothetical protein